MKVGGVSWPEKLLMIPIELRRESRRLDSYFFSYSSLLSSSLAVICPLSVLTSIRSLSDNTGASSHILSPESPSVKCEYCFSHLSTDFVKNYDFFGSILLSMTPGWSLYLMATACLALLWFFLKNHSAESKLLLNGIPFDKDSWVFLYSDYSFWEFDLSYWAVPPLIIFSCTECYLKIRFTPCYGYRIAFLIYSKFFPVSFCSRLIQESYSSLDSISLSSCSRSSMKRSLISWCFLLS